MSFLAIPVYNRAILKQWKYVLQHLYDEQGKKTPAPGKVYFNIKVNILHTPSRLLVTADSQWIRWTKEANNGF